jgi:hypothetical protein
LPVACKSFTLAVNDWFVEDRVTFSVTVSPGFLVAISEVIMLPPVTDFPSIFVMISPFLIPADVIYWLDTEIMTNPDGT